MNEKLWCEMTSKERRAFKRQRRPLTQDQLCRSGNHVWRPWEWWMQGYSSHRHCDNCGKHQWGPKYHYSPEYLNRVDPPNEKFLTTTDVSSDTPELAAG